MAKSFLNFVDELNKSTMARYTRAAARDINHQGIKGNLSKIKKRVSGIDKATHKLAMRKEEAEITDLKLREDKQMKSFFNLRDNLRENANKDYKASSEKSRFGGYRAKLINPQGKVSYLSATAWKTAKAAEGEAAAYRDGYFGGPGKTSERGADRMVHAYKQKNKKDLYKKESVEESKQLDELSPKALRNYRSKAAADQAGGDPMTRDPKRFDKRSKGIARANKKLAGDNPFELYTSMKGWERVSKDLEKALVTAKKMSDKKKAREYMFKIQKKYQKFGATDTEPNSYIRQELGEGLDEVNNGLGSFVSQMKQLLKDPKAKKAHRAASSLIMRAQEKGPLAKTAVSAIKKALPGLAKKAGGSWERKILGMKTMLIEEVELDEKFKKGVYTVRDGNTGKVIATYKSGEKASKEMYKLLDSGKYTELEVKMESVEVELDEKYNSGKVRTGDRVIYTKSGKHGVVTGTQNRAGSVVIKLAGDKYKEVKISKLEPASGPYKKSYDYEVNESVNLEEAKKYSKKEAEAYFKRQYGSKFNARKMGTETDDSGVKYWMDKGHSGEAVEMKESAELDEAIRDRISYKAGQKAAQLGKKYDTNPNTKGSQAHLDWSKGHNSARSAKIGRRNEEVELDEARFTDKQIKMAYGIVNDPRWKGGNMTEIVRRIEGIAKGLSNHPGVKAAIRRTNEDTLFDDLIAEELKFLNYVEENFDSMEVEDLEDIIEYTDEDINESDAAYARALEKEREDRLTPNDRVNLSKIRAMLS